MPYDPHDRLENYNIECLIGRGGSSKVYRARCVRGRLIGRRVALKIIPLASLPSSTHLTNHLASTAIHSRLHHPGIVSLLSVFNTSTDYCQVLELCTITLSTFITTRKVRSLTESEARSVLKALVDALLYLSREKVIHRDIKADNIFLTEDGRVKLGDFGLAAKLEPPFFEASTFCGTPNYLSPEIVRREPYGAASDLWAFGCLMITVLTGQPPFQGRTVEETYRRVQRCEFKMPESLSDEVKSLIGSLLRMRPEHRTPVDQILQHAFFDPELPVTPLHVSKNPQSTGTANVTKKAQNPVHARPRASMPSLMIATVDKENHAPTTRRPRRTSEVHSSRLNRTPSRLLRPPLGLETLPTPASTLTGNSQGQSASTKAKMNSRSRRPILGTRNVTFQSPIAASFYEPALSSTPRPRVSSTSLHKPTRPPSPARVPESTNPHSILLELLQEESPTTKDNADALHFLADASSRAARSRSPSPVSFSDSSSSSIARVRRALKAPQLMPPSPPQLQAPSQQPKRGLSAERKQGSTIVNLREHIDRSLPEPVPPLSPTPRRVAPKASNPRLVGTRKGKSTADKKSAPPPTSPPPPRVPTVMSIPPSSSTSPPRLVPQNLPPPPPPISPRARQHRNPSSVPPIIATPPVSPTPSIAIAGTVPTWPTTLQEIPVFDNTPTRTSTATADQEHRSHPPPPLCTIGLVARGHTTPHGDIEILPRSMGLMADLRRSEKKAGRPGDEVLRISEDGRLIEVFHAPDDIPVSVVSTSLGVPWSIYQLEALPPRYWKQYRFVSKFVDLLLSRIPKLVLMTPFAKCTIMSNKETPDLECSYPPPSSSTELSLAAPEGPSLVLRLARRNGVLKISRSAHSDASAIVARGARVEAESNWLTEVVELGVDDLGGEIKRFASVLGDRGEDRERLALLHLLDCLVLVFELESPRAGRAVSVWRDVVMALASPPPEPGREDPPVFIITEAAWNDLMAGFRPELEQPRAFSMPPSTAPRSHLVPKNTPVSSNVSQSHPISSSPSPLAPISNTPKDAAPSVDVSRRGAAIPRKPSREAVPVDPRLGLPTPVRSALRNVLERDVPPAPGNSQKRTPKPSKMPTANVKATPRARETTAPPPTPAVRQRPSSRDNSDARFIPSLGWCIRRAGWTTDEKEGRKPSSNVTVYNVLLLDGMSVEVDSERKQVQMTDRHGVVSKRLPLDGSVKLPKRLVQRMPVVDEFLTLYS